MDMDESGGIESNNSESQHNLNKLQACQYVKLLKDVARMLANAFHSRFDSLLSLDEDAKFETVPLSVTRTSKCAGLIHLKR